MLYTKLELQRNIGCPTYMHICDESAGGSAVNSIYRVLACLAKRVQGKSWMTLAREPSLAGPLTASADRRISPHLSQPCEIVEWRPLFRHHWKIQQYSSIIDKTHGSRTDRVDHCGPLGSQTDITEELGEGQKLKKKKLVRGRGLATARVLCIHV